MPVPTGHSTHPPLERQKIATDRRTAVTRRWRPPGTTFVAGRRCGNSVDAHERADTCAVHTRKSQVPGAATPNIDGHELNLTTAVYTYAHTNHSNRFHYAYGPDRFQPGEHSRSSTTESPLPRKPQWHTDGVPVPVTPRADPNHSHSQATLSILRPKPCRDRTKRFRVTNVATRHSLNLTAQSRSRNFAHVTPSGAEFGAKRPCVTNAEPRLLFRGSPDSSPAPNERFTIFSAFTDTRPRRTCTHRDHKVQPHFKRMRCALLAYTLCISF